MNSSLCFWMKNPIRSMHDKYITWITWNILSNTQNVTCNLFIIFLEFLVSHVELKHALQTFFAFIENILELTTGYTLLYKSNKTIPSICPEHLQNKYPSCKISLKSHINAVTEMFTQVSFKNNIYTILLT